MKLIVGLGNPGDKYINNRHNVGFMFLDFLAEKLLNTTPTYKKDKYVESQILKATFNNEEVVLAKPQTYMNKSGSAVFKLLKKYSLKWTDLIVIHDDLDIPLGKMHIQTAVGPQLHNGLESIETHLKTKNFLRARIGVDARTREKWVNGETYVLNDFSQEEKGILGNAVFPRIVELLKQPH